MHPLIKVFGKDISMYGVMLLAGIAAGVCLILFLCKFKKEQHLKWWEAIPVASIAFAGAIIGGIMLRPIMKLPEVIIHWGDIYSNYPIEDVVNYMFGEIVFYGGLIGGAAGVLISCKKLIKKPVLPIVDLFAPAVALGHAFGRIGCLFAGCCYGMHVSEDHPFAIIYPHASLSAPPGVPLLAVPVIESCCLLLIAISSTTVYMRTKRMGLSSGLYFVLYAITRFTLEFFRGDLVRGVYGGISTSQFISIGIFIVGSILIWRAFSKPKAVD